MRVPGTILIFIATVIWHSITFGQTRTHIDQITERDGLSYRWVMDIIQDHRGFLWFATYDGLNHYDGLRFTIYKHSDSDTNSLTSNRVFHVAEDGNGNIWTYGEDLVFNKIELSTGRITHTDRYYIDGSPYTGPRPSLRHLASLSNGDFIVLFQEKGNGSCSFWRYSGELNGFEFIVRIPTSAARIPGFSERRDGKVWLLGMGAGYFLVDLDTGEFSAHPVDNIELELLSGVAVPIDDQGYFWYPSDSVGSDSGGFLRKLRISDHFTPDQIRNIRHDNAGDFWINYGDSILFRLDVRSGSLEKFADQFFGESEDIRAMQRFYVDHEGAYWSGHFYGAARIENRPSLFNSYLLKSEADHSRDIDEFSARDILQYDSSNLIAKRYDNTIYLIDIVKDEVKEFNRRPLSGVDPLAEGVFGMFVDKNGFLWTSQGNKLVKNDIATGSFWVFDGPPVSQENQRRIFQDKSGRIWLCAPRGVYLFNDRGGEMTKFEIDRINCPVSPNFTYASYDPGENVIYASYQYGIYMIDCTDQSTACIEVFQVGEGDFMVTAILKWHDEFWLSTDKGLVRFNPATGERRIYDRRDGFPSDIIYSALGAEHDLWLASHNGLCRFTPGNMRIATYYMEQGLPNNEFNRWSYLKADNGHFYFGGLNGVVGFDPSEFQIPKQGKGVLNLQKLLKYNNRGDEVIEVVSNPYTTYEKIIISPYERTLSFRYSLGRLQDVSKNHYFHQLEGLEFDWIDDGSQNETRYIQIPPGEYTFRVRALGPDGAPALNEITIPIVIRQYWYLRWWAIAGYVFFVVGTISVIYRFQLARKMDRQEARRIRELEEVKSKMYTNVTHEFRTPLTVMLGMNESVNKYAGKGELDKVHQATEMIDRNARSLLDLINQMLDLSKLESGMMDVHNEYADVVAYLKYRLEAYQSYAAEKQISIEFSTGEHEILMDFDPERLSHIINNLISNAIKFTQKNGSINVLAGVEETGTDKPFLKLVVRDTGIGIEESVLPRIFDRFYQTDADQLRKGEGTGIGLSLVREMVRLLGGSIEVQSKLGEGTEFTVLLPITRNASPGPAVDRITRSDVMTDLPDLHEEEESPLVLIVEDHADVMHYIQISIDSEYRSVTASDGRAGIEKAIELIPDVIISDVMMPGTDGYQVCKAIKTDERTSHIPVILLTAKTDHDSKVEGLEQGADVYLTKPFDKKELLIRLRNLLALRAEMQRYYSGGTRALGSVEGLGTEDAYLEKVRSQISEHLEDEEFDVSKLCQLMHVSRAQLHRKLTALTGNSARQIIRQVQLEKATGLLINSDLTVSEVAYQAGFKSQAHFSRVFSDVYGSSPSDFRKKSGDRGS